MRGLGIGMSLGVFSLPCGADWFDNGGSLVWIMGLIWDINWFL